MGILTDIWDTLKALGSIVSHVLAAIWAILAATWHLIGMGTAILIALLVNIGPLVQSLAEKIPAVWDTLTASEAALNSAIAAGIPPSVALGLSYCNNFVPLGEAVVCLTTLSTTFVVCTIVRVVKSPIPLIGK